MASTFSTNLKLELIGTGDQPGTWGNTTNTNLGTLLEEAIAGVKNITISTSNYVLTNYNGVADEARNAVLVITGTPGAARTILVPSGQTKLYVVVNNTTGGFDINVQTWSGSGTTGTGAIAVVPPNASIYLYCTGSNCYSIAPYTSITAVPVVFEGYASGTTLTVTSAPSSPILAGQTVYNSGILYTASGFPDNTTIVTQLTGTTGGIGTYTISNASTVGAAAYPLPITALKTLTQIATVDYLQTQTQSVYLAGAPTADTATAAAFEGIMLDNILVATKMYIIGNPIGVGQYINGVNVYEYGTYVSAFGTGTAGNASFSGYISGTTLTVTGAVTGTITINQYIVGTGIAVGTKIVSGSGTTWQVDISQTAGSAAIPVSIEAFGPGSGDTGWYTINNGNIPLTGQVVPRTPMISFLSPLQLTNTLFVSNISYLLGTLGTQSDEAVNIRGGAISNTTITNSTISSLLSALSVSNGGTGSTSLPANAVLVGNGTSAIQSVAPGTAGNVLKSNGTSWVSGTGFTWDTQNVNTVVANGTTGSYSIPANCIMVMGSNLHYMGGNTGSRVNVQIKNSAGTVLYDYPLTGGNESNGGDGGSGMSTRSAWTVAIPSAAAGGTLTFYRTSGTNNSWSVQVNQYVASA